MRSRTRHAVRRVLTPTVALLGLVGGLLAATPPASAEPVINLTPGAYPRGPETPVPHVTGNTLIHGKVRITIRWPQVEYLGRIARGYGVRVSRTDGSRVRVLRVNPDGSRRILLRGGASWRTQVDEAHGRVVTPRNMQNRTRVTIRARNGQVLKRRMFPRSSMLDTLNGVIVLTSRRPARTVAWHPMDGRVRLVTRRTAYIADLLSQRYAYFTKDPYAGGCSVVSSMQRPNRKLWRSCRQRAEQFAPGGRRMLTVHKLTDGPGPNRVQERRIRGGLLATYRAFAITDMQWSTRWGKLFLAHGRKNMAYMNCTQECYRASALERSPI